MTINKVWNKRISSALAVIDKTEKQQKFQCTHTADGKKLKVGLKVFSLDFPTKLFTIIAIDKEITLKKKTITLSLEDEIIKRHPTKLYVDQEKLVYVAIADIILVEKSIVRNTEEQLNRLDAKNRVKELKKLADKI